VARNEQDREDLIREAVALTQRTEFDVPELAEHVVIGFRVTGACSIYLGADPVYQFDEQHRLRRAFVDGRLFRSQPPTLVELTRQRTDQHTTLLSRDLSAAECDDFLNRMRSRLTTLAHAIQSGSITVRGTVPADTDLLPAISNELQAILVADPWLSSGIRPRR
jgi:hypothetical protein